jgi:three-Cys-motif partner protein
LPEVLKRRKKMAGLQEFGGDWTQEKLSRVSSYLTAYTTALKNAKFDLVYIDAFAGTGYRNQKTEANIATLFSDQVGEDAEAFHAGSARIALETVPPFSQFYFIEQSEEKCTELEKLKQDFPEKASQIKIVNGDANAALLEICKVPWKRRNVRGVLFLDPFGMNVSWTTVEAVAKTEAIDMWYLFPLGVGVSRLLRKDGNIPEAWRKRLDNIFGNTDWESIFYKKETIPSLFGEEEVVTKVGDFQQIAEYFVKRLATVFAGVAPNPLQLMNSKRNPLYLLCFACGNKNGAPIAKRIAAHILKGKKP